MHPGLSGMGSGAGKVLPQRSRPPSFPPPVFSGSREGRAVTSRGQAGGRDPGHQGAVNTWAGGGGEGREGNTLGEGEGGLSAELGADPLGEPPPAPPRGCWEQCSL